MNRILFIKSVFFLMFVLFDRARGFFLRRNQAEIQTYHCHSLEDAFHRINFVPNEEDCSFFVVAADIHYEDGKEDGLSYIIDDIHSMNYKPDFFCVNGDLICHASPSFGVIPDENLQRIAIQEFVQFKKDLELLDMDIMTKLVLGNHDTHPLETTPDIFWSVFQKEKYPAYQSMDLKGIHFIFLNGHSTGYIDEEQKLWLRNDIYSISKKSTIILFIHQPSVSHRVRERGIPMVIKEFFLNHEGLVWLIGGHEHRNFQEIYELVNSRLIVHGITTASENVWRRHKEEIGYWIYCLKEGDVKCRIFKQKNGGYEILENPDIRHASRIPIPFDNCKNVLWKVLTGNDENDYLIDVCACNCLNYWAYVKFIIYKLPLYKVNGRASFIALLSEYKKADRELLGQYFISSDLKNWLEIKLCDYLEDLLLFVIPDCLKNNHEIYFKFNPVSESSVAGIALLSNF